MQNKVNYAFVGFFVLTLMAVLIFIGIWLSKGWNAKRYTTYAAYISESVSGLAQDGTVKYNGVNVGNISSITLDTENPERVRVLMKIEANMPISEATTARLITQGLTGVSFIELTTNQPNSPRLIARPGELYPVIKTAPSLFSRLDTAASELIIRLNKTMDSLDKTFDKSTQQSIQNILLNLDKITKNFSENTHELDNAIKHADAFFKNGAEAGTKLTNGLNTFSGETLPKVDLLVDNLTVVSSQLSDLGNEISQNPSMLLKGRVPFKKGPGE